MSSAKPKRYAAVFGFHIRDAAELQAYCVRHNLRFYRDSKPVGVSDECRCFGIMTQDMRRKLSRRILGVADAYPPGPPGPDRRDAHIIMYVLVLAQEVSTEPITEETRNRRAEEIPKAVIDGVKQLLDRTDDPVWYECRGLDRDSW
ncbi:hypothetical protein ONZ51_g5018 [Trametes cubensis]|uniref:Uncharacterized protein n=1 Tax=Trametes cubensis TaxID=1111947 RepID=A0AAD7TUS0_9APHY|nr:hypothetical protein ONZ51_g5018 [Trametes cubensis]